MKFSAKIEWWAHISCAAGVFAPIAILVLYAGLIRKEGDTGIIVIFVLNMFIIGLSVVMAVFTWLNTYYVLNDDGLLIKSGMFRPRLIPYAKITRVAPLKSWGTYLFSFGSAAFSPDMVEIFYIDSGIATAVLVSPQDKADFLRELEFRRSLNETNSKQCQE